MTSNDNRHSFTHSSPLSATTTFATPAREYRAEGRIRLRVPTPEDTAKHNALLEQASCLRDFIKSYNQLESYKNGAPLALTGDALTIPTIIAVARYPELVSAAIGKALAELTADPSRVESLARSRKIIDDKLAQNKSIYGVSTGFGGSADTRTAEYENLGLALLQHHHVGVLPSALASIADANASSITPSVTASSSLIPLPLSGSLSSTSMPAAWTRAAMLVRLNSLLRGHSAASLPLLNAIGGLLFKDITPIVPLRASISASGDLTPLSYIAGTIIGERGIFCYTPRREKSGEKLGETEKMGMSVGGAQILRAADALKAAGLQPIRLRPKEQLAILNGTAFSCGAAALCVEEARQLVMLGTVCTAMGTEAMRGTADSFCEFIQRVRPHPGQVETGALLTYLLATSKLATRYAEPGSHCIHDSMAESGKDRMVVIDEKTIDADAGVLRQDRYPLRTATQWLGPQLETVQRAAEIIAIECNSTTDNPLIDPDTGVVHHGGNFQAMAVTSAMEPLRLAVFHIAKLLFAQATELQNPTMSNGLTGNLASTDASLNFAGKGVDIAMAAYVAELSYLANPVSTGVQSAEMHNQAVNSMALVSARYTLQAIEVAQMVVASYIYLLCQAVDLRALQKAMEEKTHRLVSELVKAHFGEIVKEIDAKAVGKAVWSSFDTSTNMDSKPRAEKAAKASTQPLVEQLLSSSSQSAATVLFALPAFQSALSSAIYDSHQSLTTCYLTSTSSASSSYYLPALPLLGRTKSLYQFVRSPVSEGGLGIGMHGLENLRKFNGGVLGSGEGSGRGTIGAEISAIYEAIRDGRITRVVVGMFSADA